MDSFFLIDKPQGITSFGVLKQMRNILKIKKLGHTGTLDPLATGCLLVATGKYTKLIPYFEKDTKEYECTIMLDGTSDSYDSDTPISYISQDRQKYFSETLLQSKIQKILEEKFLGTITQIPPVYSALKIGGKKAVDLVREGNTPEMKSRQVTISQIQILAFSYPVLKLQVTVSAGTYIRSLAKDLGDILETGGYISQLRRTKIGNISVTDGVSLDILSAENIFPETQLFPADMFCSMKDTTTLQRLSNGQKVAGDFGFPQGKDIFLFSENKIQYIVRYQDGVLTPIKKILS